MQPTYALVLPTLGLFFAGCTLTAVSYDREPRHVYETDNAIVVQAPPPPRPDQVVVVQDPPPQPLVAIQAAPPPVRVEQIPPPPGPEFVWVPGYWVAQRDRWVWVRGRYDRPPHRGAVWVEPRYERRGDTFRFSAGFWR